MPIETSFKCQLKLVSQALEASLVFQGTLSTPISVT